MKFLEKTKGAISIFLVIILVPMMTVSALFVDASKLKLGKALAESAGDLTLNTALTNYDTKIKELYGLMATAQDTDDLFSRLEEYYRTCITSAGVSEADADDYVEQIMAQLGSVSKSDDTSDILNMELVEFSASKFSNADLANPTILQKQIVDFMKYRAPINTGLSFVSSLKNFSTLSKQSELVEKKQKYYEEQQSVMEHLKTAWSHIAAYNGTQIVKDTTYLNTIKNELKEYKTGTYGYKTLNKWLVMDLYDAANYVNYTCSVTKLDEQEVKTANGTTKRVSLWRFVYSGTGSVSPQKDYRDYYNDYNKDKLPNVETIEKLITNFHSNLQSMESYGAEVEKISNATNAYDLQQLLQANRKSLSNYTNKALSVYTTYQQLKNAMIWVEAYDSKQKSEIKNKEITVNGKKSKIVDCFKDIENNLYENAMKKMSGIGTTFTDISVNETAPNGTNNYLGKSSTAGSTVGTISTNVNAYISELKKSSEHLNKAISSLNSAKTKLTGSVATAKSNWNAIATDASIKSTNLAKQDQAEINQLDTYLNATNIDKLVTRLTNIKKEIDAAISQIEGYKYDDVFIGKITTYSELESAIGNKRGPENLKNVPIDRTKLEQKANEWWNTSWTDGGLKTDWTTKSGSEVDLTKNKLSMYSYLYSHFASNTTAASSNSDSTKTQDEDTKNGKDLYKNIKSTSKSQADKNTSTSAQASSKSVDKDGKQNEIINVGTEANPLPSKGTAGEVPSGKANTDIDNKKDKDGKDVDGAAGKNAKSLSSMFGTDFLSSVSSMGTDLRDKLYVSDYIMSMFSYDTIENEYKKTKNVTEIKAGDIKSLTKCDISLANNYSYGSEVEYILYGGTTKSNLTKAYGSIYGIRFGFNLVYAFATSEIRDSALAIATPISAATLGVIPVPLIQAVVIIGIACCESGIDLASLKAGEKVPLYKTSKTWRCSITGLVNIAKEQTGELLKKVSSDVVDEGVNKLNELLDMSDEELNKLIDKGAGDITESVGDVYDTVITENMNIAIQQLSTYITTAVEKTRCLEAGETYENKKTQMKAWVKTELQKWGNQFTGNDLPSIVKKEAVTVIANNSDSFIDGFFDIVETKLNSTANINELTSLGSEDALGGAIMSKIEEIRNKLTSTIMAGSEKVKKAKKEMIDKVAESIDKGADDLKNTLNEQIDGIFGGASGSGDASTAGASLFSFSYSDYIRLFLLIGLYSNENGVMLRTADVIQANMIKKCGGGTDFNLRKSIAYVKIEATIQVKPTLLALPLFADVEKNPATNSNWYTFKYSGIAGY